MTTSAVARYNALLIATILALALASLAYNNHLIYADRLAHARQMLSVSIHNHVLDHLRADAQSGIPPGAARLAEILHEGLHMPGVTAFGAVLDNEKRIVAAVGLLEEAREAILAHPAGRSDFVLAGDGDLELLSLPATADYRIVAGFSRKAVARDVWPITANTALFVAAALAVFFLLAFAALRQWIVAPLIRFLDGHLRGTIDSIVSGNPPPPFASPRFNLLPEDISVNIERNMSALHTWARHKANFDRFIALSTAENDKQQLAANLYNMLGLELPIKNLAILEINHSLNRLNPVYDAAGGSYADDLLANPQRCFVYRSGSRLVQLPGETVCPCCLTPADEVLICLPLVAAGKEMGVCKIILDRARLDRELAAAGNGNPVAVAEALAASYVFLTALSLSNLTLLDSYKNQAVTDGLTGLYNRRYMVEYLVSLLGISKRSGKSLALFMVDIDNFKRLNDEYGHNVGDQVLQVVARTMRRAIREGDIIARYGGEEFVVALPETDSALASDVGERLRQEVASIEWDHFGLGNIPLVTVSIGVAEFPLHGYSHYHLINAADKALYVAKRSGKNRVVLHQSLPQEESENPQERPNEEILP